MEVRVITYGEANKRVVHGELSAEQLEFLEIQETGEAVQGRVNLPMNEIQMCFEFVAEAASAGLIGAAARRAKDLFASLRRAQREDAVIDKIVIDDLPPRHMTLLTAREKDQILDELEREILKRLSQQSTKPV